MRSMVSKKLIVATMTCVKKGERLGADLGTGPDKAGCLYV